MKKLGVEFVALGALMGTSFAANYASALAGSS
jgi:hypothetical protein